MMELAIARSARIFLFFHPTTGEQYALARTEKNRLWSYCLILMFRHGNLEDDLKRRDLTNAIAEGLDGKLIDPFGGLSDIKNKLLKHVSEAFCEDPLRALEWPGFMQNSPHLIQYISRYLKSYVRD